MKKADYILIFVLLIMFGVFPLISLINGNENEAKQVVVEVDGKIVKQCSIAENSDFTIENDYGINRIVISDGYVSMVETDCGNKDCIKIGSINMPGKNIICLPHHLCVYIKASDMIEQDGVAY